MCTLTLISRKANGVNTVHIKLVRKSEVMSLRLDEKTASVSIRAIANVRFFFDVWCEGCFTLLPPNAKRTGVITNRGGTNRHSVPFSLPAAG